MVRCMVDVNAGLFNFMIHDAMEQVGPDHPNYDKIVEAYRDGADEDELSGLISVAKSVESYFGGDGQVVVKNGYVYYGDNIVHNVVADRILTFMSKGLPVEGLKNFLANLMANPSFNSRKQLYSFLEHQGLPITEDGCFLAYKSVKRESYLSHHSGAATNGHADFTPGNVVEIARELVDDNPDNHCSAGLHAGALEYVRGFYGHEQIIIVKINPKDVVSVPNDHNCTKLRACRIESVGDYKGELHAPLYKNDATDWVAEDEFDDCDDHNWDDDCGYCDDDYTDCSCY